MPKDQDTKIGRYYMEMANFDMEYAMQLYQEDNEFEKLQDNGYKKLV
jgi:hypothetical protein